MMLGLPARACRRRCDRAGEARATSCATSAATRASVDARRDGTTGPARRASWRGRTTRRTSCARTSRRQRSRARRLRAPADALQVHRADAAVGLPGLPARRRPSAIPASSCCWTPRPTGLVEARRARAWAWRSATPDGALADRAPTWWSAPTAATRCCAARRAWRCATSARRSTCCGCACPASRAIPRTGRLHRRRPLHGDASIAAPTGSAPTSSPRAASTAIQARGHRRASAPRWRRSRRCLARSRRRTSRAGTTSSCSSVHGRPARALVEAGPAVHRRRGACDVAGRRRRHQPRGAGRRGRGQPAARPRWPTRAWRPMP